MYIDSYLLLHFAFPFDLFLFIGAMKFVLVVGGQRGPRGHHIRYARSKASELHLNLGLNFIDISYLISFLLLHFVFFWTHFKSLEPKVWLGGGWPTRPPHIRYAHS